jgi:Bacterial membrane flanked domain.
MTCYSMNPRQPPFNTIIIQPHFLQWIINQLPLIVITVTSLLACGVEGVAFPRLLYALTILLSLQLLYTFIYMRSMEYRITDQQIIFEHGVFKKSTDYMELYRVIDFTEHRNIMQQICALKTTTIYAGDRNMPKLHIIGMKNHYDFVSELRRRVIHSREIHHIYEVTNRI